MLSALAGPLDVVDCMPVLEHDGGNAEMEKNKSPHGRMYSQRRNNGEG
jgi:hypothetical protein